MCSGACQSGEGVRSPEAVVTGTCELPTLGPGSQPWSSGRASNTLSRGAIFPAPLLFDQLKMFPQFYCPVLSFARDKRSPL